MAVFCFKVVLKIFFYYCFIFCLFCVVLGSKLRRFPRSPSFIHFRSLLLNYSQTQRLKVRAWKQQTASCATNTRTSHCEQFESKTIRSKYDTGKTKAQQRHTIQTVASKEKGFFFCYLQRKVRCKKDVCNLNTTKSYTKYDHNRNCVQFLYTAPTDHEQNSTQSC